MKWMIASDIHGSAYYCEKMLEAYRTERAEALLLLGDILYHGARNDLPRGYAPKRVIELLNAAATDIFAVRGNCESEVDQMVLNFPMAADYCILEIAGRMVFATHGHMFNADHLPALKSGSVLLYGHTHVPLCTECEGIICLNPGSVAIPKKQSAHGYMTMDENKVLWKDFEQNITNMREL